MTQTTDHLPVYTADHPPVPDTDSLRQRIPGWGADLDKEDRPSVPKLKFLGTGAWWDFPERQPENQARERSVEHRFLTPAFGTAQPLKGVSGVLRRFAYKFGEGRALHWLILLYADRVDAAEHHILSVASLRPDNPITQTGVKAEWTRNGVKSRVSRKRVDTHHMWLDPLIVGGPWLLAAVAITRLVRKRRSRA